MQSLVLTIPQAHNIFGSETAASNFQITRSSVVASQLPLSRFLDHGVKISSMKKLGFTDDDLLRGGMRWRHLRMEGNSFNDVQGAGEAALKAGWTMPEAENLAPTPSAAELTTFGLTCDAMVRKGGMTATTVLALDQIPLVSWRSLGMTLDHVRALGMNSNHFTQMSTWGSSAFMENFSIDEAGAARFCAPAPPPARAPPLPSSDDESEGGGGNGGGAAPQLSEAARRLLAHMKSNGR